MRHYCTLFDSKYLPQGLALYESLKRHSSQPFELHMLPMDLGLECALTLTALHIGNFTTLGALESYNPKLEDLRLSRSWQEHCWTMASVYSHWLLTYQGIKEITYLDADMLFFSDPEIIFREIGDKSIAVIPHRFIPSKQHLEVNGRFNVSWVTFKNTPVGRECLSTWARQCRERCSAKYGCGDQGYLDEWPAKYGDKLCIIQNIGAGLAPWNLANYYPMKNETTGQIVLMDKHGTIEPVVFYHYHEYLHGERLTNYELRPEDVEFIYRPYIEAVNQAKQRIETIHLQPR